MGYFRNILYIVFAICFSANSFAQYIQVDDTYSAQKLIENVLINSPCANASNFISSGDTFSLGEQSFGYFKSVSNNFPFKEGVLLCTSRANMAVGPNDNLIDEGQVSWHGDKDLENALNISNTFNATILEFDFIPKTSSFSFDYIFVSEEYGGKESCEFSDGFAFLLKEANTTKKYQNLAVLPDTNIPVLVTNVHPNIPGFCPSINETYFGAYNDDKSPINYNGQTVVMTAKATVIPGIKYHIKLVIADHRDTRYDSAIFLDGGSFNMDIDLGPDQLVATQNSICQGETYTLDATEFGNNSYKWFKNNSIISGETKSTYTVTSPGIYKVEITLDNSTCKATDEVTIEYSSLPILAPATIVQCDDDNDGKSFFNLSSIENIIKNNDSSLGRVNYYLNLLGAINEDKSQLITNPTNFQSPPTTIFASVKNDMGCANTTSVSLQISNKKGPAFIDFEKCDTDEIKDGFYGFNLSEITPKVISGLPLGLEVIYYETITDALFQQKKLSDIYINKTRYEMTIYAKILNGADCYEIIPIHLFANSNSPKNFGDEVVSICNGGKQKLEIDSGFQSYLWSNGADKYFTQISEPGEYTVTVSDINTCLATKKFIVSKKNTSSITKIEINDFQGNSNSVLIHYQGDENSEFSIDGINYQKSPYFTNVLSGVYTVWIKNDCGIDFEKIYVLNYPKFFTPNNDGFNDSWKIENLDKLPFSKIIILDRYGKLIYQFNGNNEGWNGQFNSINLPSTDYWFVVTLENDKIIKGHFSLIR